MTMKKFPQKYNKSKLKALLAKAETSLGKDSLNTLNELFPAFADFYGIIHIGNVHEILTEHYGMSIEKSAFLDYCEYVRHAQDNHIYIFGLEEYTELKKSIITVPYERYLVHEMYLMYEDDFLRALDLKVGKPWYIPELEYLKHYNSSTIWYDEKEFSPLKKVLVEEFGIDEKYVAEAAMDIMFMLRQDYGDYESFLNEIQKIHRNLTFEQAQSLMPYYVKIRNNSRLCVNNGYTPIEAEELKKQMGFSTDTLFVDNIVLDRENEQERWAAMDSEINSWDSFADRFEKLADQYTPSNSPIRSVKIGRNEPCPCGSGKKYKKCCGR